MQPGAIFRRDAASTSRILSRKPIDREMFAFFVCSIQLGLGPPGTVPEDTIDHIRLRWSIFGISVAVMQVSRAVVTRFQKMVNQPLHIPELEGAISNTCANHTLEE